MSSEVIVLENASKSYRFAGREFKDRSNLLNFFGGTKFQALDNINFSISSGDCVGFIGKNGAGKTILLKVVAGIVYPSSGRVIIKKPVSPIFEYGAGFHPELTGKENIILYGSLLGIRKKEIKRHFDEIVDFSGLGKFLDLKIKHYSTGMRIRLAFSVASLLKPEILILDEALSAGDQSFVKKVHSKIEELQNLGVTMLITSHSFEILRKFCKKGFVLDTGLLAYSGDINSSIDYYKENILKEENEQKVLLKNLSV